MIVACVRTGKKYDVEYVELLRAMVERHLGCEFQFVVLSDEKLATFDCVPVELPGWWAKLELFKPEWRRGHRVLYFDLDTVIFRSINALAEVEEDFAVCENFSRRRGIYWPCKYGSCCMTIADGWGVDIWERFSDRRWPYMQVGRRYGDQFVLEQLIPEAPYLQTLLPDTFIHYKDLTDDVPKAGSVIVFGGNKRPDNTPFEWVKDAWQMP